MGGIGASFGAGGSASVTAVASIAVAAPKTAKDYNDIASLRQYATDKLGIHLASTLDGCDFGLVRKANAKPLSRAFWSILKKEFG